MLITGFPAGPLQANCYLIAPDRGQECIIVDPGQQSAEPLREMLATFELRPAAIAVTHGHFDHVAGARELTREHSIDAYIGAGDVDMLTGQLSAMPAAMRATMTALTADGEDLDDLRPDRVTPVAGGEHLHVAGVDMDVLAVPGHTPGSVTYRLAGADGEPGVVFTGDTLFAGTIGRTDLPGGSSSQILESIRTRLMSLPDDTVVLPGHGEATTIGAERAANPFLRRG